MNVEYEMQIKKYFDSFKQFPSYVLGIDVGGTSTNIAISAIQNDAPLLLLKFTFNTKQLPSLLPAIQQVLFYGKENYDIDVCNACIGSSGVISADNNTAFLTNISWNVNGKKIIEKTKLTSVFIINDFQAIGYGLNSIDLSKPENVMQIRPEISLSSRLTQNRAIIGAGTGFGKCFLTYDKTLQTYIPHHSEGGHSDIACYCQNEKKIFDYIKIIKNLSAPVSYEDILSGSGIEYIYSFLLNQKKGESDVIHSHIANSDDKASLISKYRHEDEICQKTFELFTCFYARCAKNFVLDTMATGGLFIAGGIASKNSDLFKTQYFLDEFMYSQKRSDVLKNIPIYVILNYDISLYGACFAAIHKNLEKRK